MIHLTAAQSLACSLGLALTLAACKPPPTDTAEGRAEAGAVTRGPSAPLDSPDTEGAVWSPGQRADRIIYGKPGEPPLFAVECLREADGAALQFTRYAKADEGALAFMALIGNGHVARVPVDAVERNGQSVWEGQLDPADPRSEVLTGRRSFTATVPGAGMMRINPSPMPMELVEACRPKRDRSTFEP